MGIKHKRQVLAEEESGPPVIHRAEWNDVHDIEAGTIISATQSEILLAAEEVNWTP